jgi:hypothetical protein
MPFSVEKNAGLSLIVFTLLISFTVILHPAGGNIAHLIEISPILLITHSVAILSLPFAAIGFWGLTRYLGSNNFLSISGFSMACLALIAALLAATANGITMPIFIHPYKEASPETLESLRLTLAYNHAVNMAFDFVYTGLFCLAVLFWSVTALVTRRLSGWLAGWGIVVASGGIAITIGGTSPASLHGFHIFVMGLISWLILVGQRLLRGPRT